LAKDQFTHTLRIFLFPEDIEKGKYKIAIEVTQGGDEQMTLFINKVKNKVVVKAASEGV
jgi:hypothetical protein